MAKKLTSSKAREILHDKSVHGHPLTDKQRRFFGAIAGGAKPYKAESGGWLDKYDTPIAQNGIEGTMGGLTDIGFNYNGAWGGPSMENGGNLMPAMAGANQTVPMAQLGDSVKPITMQLAIGGSLPGATGGMYARTGSVPRTINPAPDNGPGAKKTKASAQNGMEMKYYQEGLDFKPKTISQDGGVYDVLKQRLPSDATRVAAPIIPLTEKEKAEAAKLAAEGQRRAAERDRQILEERKLRASTKGNINVPGSFNIAEKARMFPESVGGFGEMLDEYVNPLYTIGSLADALGESVAAKDPKAFVTAAALTAGIGALGFDPMGAAIKNKGAAKNIANLFKSSHQRIPAGPTIEQRLAEIQNVPALSLPEVVSNTPLPPPNIIGRINPETGEITRTAEQFLDRFRNIEREPDLFEGLDVTPSRPLDPLEEYYQRNPASDPTRFRQTETFREEMRRRFPDVQRNPPILDREEMRRRFRQIDEADLTDYSAPLSESEMARMSREVEEYEASAAREEGISDIVPPTRPITGPKFGEKDFKFDKSVEPGESDMIDPQTGTRYSQNIRDYSNFTSGNYSIYDREGYITLSTTIPKNTDNPVLNVNSITFANSNEKEATRQFNKVMSNLPSRVDMGEISTSIYSQPLMNSQLSRWANNQPGRIELKNIRMDHLNPIKKQGDYVNQIIEQFPKIKKTYKTLSETTGQPLEEPVLQAYKRATNEHIPITLERLNTEAGKKWARENGEGSIKILVPKFKVQKNWQNGGVAVDSDGYWNPENWGKPVIIPSTDITMEGVDQPLIGISDTGDVQYMQPGEDYSFDGEYVTEYPVARKGVSVNMADQYPIEKLDQSLNFTNYNKPTKGGWLDKYK